MTAKEKVEAIRSELVGIDSVDMTTAELKIRSILDDSKPTVEEKRRASINSARL